MEKINYKKKYGQNFLQDQNILEKIANIVCVKEDDLIIEIGPGNGKLTEKLLRYNSFYLGYEIDGELKKHLDKYLGDKVHIHYQNFLESDIKKDISAMTFNNLYIIANIPYYITTPILTKIIESDIPVTKQVLMVQKEVAERLTARPGGKKYGSLSVYLNCYYRVKKMFDVSRSCFIPIPNVDSTAILLERDYKINDVDEQILHKLIRDSFQFKRKQLKNNLKTYDLEKIAPVLKNHHLDFTSRAEELSLEVFIAMAKVIGHK